MYRTYDIIGGTHGIIYRSPTQIKADIESIRKRIKEANEKINVRALLLDILGDERTIGEPEFWIPELRELVSEAQAAYDSLRSLEQELSELCEELRETRWALRN